MDALDYREPSGKTYFEREKKYIVIKIQDLHLYADDVLWKLDDVLKRIEYGREKDGRDKDPKYVVVNEDEPYAEQVWALIKEHWEKGKHGQK